MSANTSFATTTSTLTQFISKQRITNSTFTEDLSSTEYPLTADPPLIRTRYDNLKITTISIPAASIGSNGYLTQSDWTTFSNKLSSITSGQNIITTAGASPSIALSISSLIDMSNFEIKNISFEDFKQNIDIRQANVQRIYTTPTQMVIAPNGNLNIQSDISLNGKTLDMSGGGIIANVSSQSFNTNIDIKQGVTSRIYTIPGGNMEIAPSGILKIKRDLNVDGNNLDMNNGNILNIKDANFMTEVDIQKNGTPLIYTDTLPTKLNIEALGFLNIKSDISMNASTYKLNMGGSTLNMGGGVLNMGGGTLNMGTGGTLNLTGAAFNIGGGTLDMGGGPITNVSSQSFNTNIDIRQGVNQIIYTNTVPTKLNIDAPATGFINVLADISMNANRLNMGGGMLDMGGGIINMGTSSSIYTTDQNMSIDPLGTLSILSDLSMNANNVKDISGIYALSSKNLLIDASSVTFKNTSAQTHMVIDNCGIILNDISSSETGTVLSYNKTNGRVHYDSLYDSSINVMKLDGGGALSANYNIKIHRIADTITLSIPDANCVIGAAGSIYSIEFDKILDTTYRPSNDVNFLAAVYDNDTVYTTGKVKVSSGGIISIYNDITQNTTVWTNGKTSGIESQCFTYIRG